MLTAVALLVALLPPAALAVGGGYLPFLDPHNVDEFWTALDLRTALNKLTVIGAACARTEEALRERYEEEGRLVLEQYTVDRGAEEAYQRLVEELLEAEERELDRARAACVTQQREYLVEVVKQGLERIEFLVGVDPAAAIAFLRRADKNWENIRLGLEECQQLYAQISDGTSPEVVSEEKMCRAEEVELLLGALQRFVDQASEMVKKAEDTPLGNLPVIPLDSDHVGDAGRDGDPLLDLKEVAEGPVDLEKYLPGILPVVPGRPDSGLVETSAPLTGEVTPTAKTTAEGPTEMTEDPTIIIGGPSGVTEGPTEMREDPTILIGGPGEVTGGPTEMKEDSTVFTRGPSEVTGGSTKMKEVTGGPTKMTEDSTVFTRGPSGVTGGPTEMTEDDHSDNGSTKVPGDAEDVSESPRPASNDGIPSDEVITESSSASPSTQPSARSALSRHAGSARLLNHSPVPSEGEVESTVLVVVWSCVAAVTMMLLAVAGVCVLVVLVLRRRFRQTQFQLPLIVEKRQVNVMKEIGYINPTYRFHELQESKKKTCH